LALDRQIDAQQPQDTVQAITARIAADADEYARAWTYNGRTVRASVRAAYLAGYLAAVQTVAANLTRQDDEKGAR
jgi:Tfp pilus assembly protein PilV